MKTEWRSLIPIINILFLITCFLPPQPALSASFDCSAARSRVDRLICDTPALSELDDRLGAAYSAAVSKVQDPEKLRAAQRAWISKRNLCGEISCMIGAYAERLVQLQEVGPAAPTSHRSASASEVQGATNCDLLAAHPFDPQKVSPGVSYATLNAPNAIQACMAAISANSKESRFHFQLGRALEKSNRISDAANSYRLAADLGHPGGNNNLGELYRDGKGFQRNLSLALEQFQIGANKNYPEAQFNLAELLLRNNPDSAALDKIRILLLSAKQAGYSDADRLTARLESASRTGATTNLTPEKQQNVALVTPPLVARTSSSHALFTQEWQNRPEVDRAAVSALLRAAIIIRSPNPSNVATAMRANWDDSMLDPTIRPPGPCDDDGPCPNKPLNARGQIAAAVMNDIQFRLSRFYWGWDPDKSQSPQDFFAKNPMDFYNWLYLQTAVPSSQALVQVPPSNYYKAIDVVRGIVMLSLQYRPDPILSRMRVALAQELRMRWDIENIPVRPNAGGPEVEGRLWRTDNDKDRMVYGRNIQGGYSSARDDGQSLVRFIIDLEADFISRHMQEPKLHSPNLRFEVFRVSSPKRNIIARDLDGNAKQTGVANICVYPFQILPFETGRFWTEAEDALLLHANTKFANEIEIVKRRASPTNRHHIKWQRQISDTMHRNPFRDGIEAEKFNQLVTEYARYTITKRMTFFEGQDFTWSDANHMFGPVVPRILRASDIVPLAHAVVALADLTKSSGVEAQFHQFGFTEHCDIVVRLTADEASASQQNFDAMIDDTITMKFQKIRDISLDELQGNVLAKLQAASSAYEKLLAAFKNDSEGRFYLVVNGIRDVCISNSEDQELLKRHVVNYLNKESYYKIKGNILSADPNTTFENLKSGKCGLLFGDPDIVSRVGIALNRDQVPNAILFAYMQGEQAKAARSRIEDEKREAQARVEQDRREAAEQAARTKDEYDRCTTDRQCRKEREEREAAVREQAKRNHRAYITCEVAGQSREVLLCLMGGSGYIHGGLKYSNQQTVVNFSEVDMLRERQLRSSEFEIDLGSRFELTIQANGSEYTKLTVRIMDGDGKTVFRDSAVRYQVIRFRK